MFEELLERLAETAKPPDQICRSPDMPGLRVCTFDCTVPPDAPLLCLKAGHYEALFWQEGELVIDMTDGRAVRADRGDILLLSDLSQVTKARITRGHMRGILVSVHGPKAKGGLEQLCTLLGGLRLETEQVGARMRACGGCTAIHGNVWSDGVFTVIEAMPFEGRGRYCVLKAAELLILLCGGQIPLPQAPSKRDGDALLWDEMRRVRDYMLSHLEKPMTIEWLARHFCLSPTQLKNDFRRVYGQPLHGYLQDNRMRRAAELLLTTAWPVAQVAEQVGYRSASQFGAAFKRRYHKSPMQYRLSVRKKPETDNF